MSHVMIRLFDELSDTPDCTTSWVIWYGFVGIM